MSLFHDTIQSWQDWGKVYQSIESFQELAESIYRKEGVPMSGFSHCTPGTNAVFRNGDTVIKIFAPGESGPDPISDYNTERFGLKRAEELGIPAPKLLASGEVRDRYLFRYFIMEYIKGQELFDYRKGRDEAERVRIGRELRLITDRLNRPCAAPNRIDVKKRALTAKRWEVFSESFNRERTEYLEQLEMPEKVYVHGDLTPDNILVTPGGELVLIDFADALLAPACYELPTVLLEVFEFDRAFLNGYFGRETGNGEEAERIAAECFDGLMLHDYGGDLIRRHLGTPEELTDLDSLRSRLIERILFGKRQ